MVRLGGRGANGRWRRCAACLAAIVSIAPPASHATAIPDGVGGDPVAAVAPPGTAPAGPQAIIAELSVQFFATVGALPKSRRVAERVEPLIDQLLAPRFDADYAARLVLGRRWNDATPSQQAAFAEAYYRRLIRTYVSAVASWTPERFKLLPSTPDAAALQATVRTQIAQADGEPVAVDYRLRQVGAGWKIYDILVDGISYDRSHRDDIALQLSRHSLDEVVAQLNRNDTAEAGRVHARPRRPN